jgi:decaprenylphospho-beta-D-erythro-pentofuranosid-2-ulose 2-reductase
MHGHVLIFSSVAGIRPRRRNFVYGLTKFGVDFLAQGLQKVNCKKNVYITILRPGFVFTKMTSGLHPAPFATDVDKVGKIAAKAILKRKRIVYAPRALFLLMGVLRILPEHLFRKIDN